jgi:hypothetical protein
MLSTVGFSQPTLAFGGPHGGDGGFHGGAFHGMGGGFRGGRFGDFTRIDFAVVGSIMIDFTTAGFSLAEHSHIRGGATIHTTMVFWDTANPLLPGLGTTVLILRVITHT